MTSVFGRYLLGSKNYGKLYIHALWLFMLDVSSLSVKLVRRVLWPEASDISALKSLVFWAIQGSFSSRS